MIYIAFKVYCTYQVHAFPGNQAQNPTVVKTMCGKQDEAEGSEDSARPVA